MGYTVKLHSGETVATYKTFQEAIAAALLLGPRAIILNYNNCIEWAAWW